MYYSFIIPTFNRPDEVTELLESFTMLLLPSSSTGFDGFEIILADGSVSEVLKPIVEVYKSKLTINHLHKPKLAISPSRNLGGQHAKGGYIIFLDSDVILPPEYLQVVHNALRRDTIDAFGGPDAAHASFTDIQKAISYAMTSYLTTGGIRGKAKQIHQYNPRGFNMGVRKTVFEQVGGYSTFECGEDIELSIRIIEAGFVVKLIPEAFVYHKRRTTFKSFFRQVFRFGAARINIYYRHRSELKLTHLFPAAFFLFLLVGFSLALVSFFLFKIFLGVIMLYYGIIFFDASLKNKSIAVGILSVVASTLQLCGYGIGFLLNAYAVFIKGNRNGISLGASK